MKYYLYLIFFYLFLNLSLLSQSNSDLKKIINPEELYKLSNKNFIDKKYFEASSGYESLIKNKYFNPEILYNLSVSKYKENKLGESILWLRRLKIIDSKFPETKQNMKYLEKKTGFLKFNISFFKNFFSQIPRDYFINITITSFLVIITILLLFMTFKKIYTYRTSLNILLLSSISIFVISLLLSLYINNNYSYKNIATIIKKDIRATTSPSSVSELVMEIPLGSEVKIIQRSGPWTYIDIPGKVRGWIKSNTVVNNWPIK